MKPILFTLLASAVLAACGSSGGESEAPAPATAVPASVGDSVASYVGYVATMAVDDQRDALTVDAVVPPTSDTDEPLALQ